MAFVPRLTKPEAGNKYYNTIDAGGYSRAIKGSPTDKGCNVLHNCVGYAYGRFNEIVGAGSCKYLAPTNAELFIQYKGSCEVGQTPRLGACMVWQKGATFSGSDGAGHVAIVEKIISPTEVVTSESGWKAKNAFWTQTRKKGDGNWGAGAGYKFLGFIYNPAVPADGTPVAQPMSATKVEYTAPAPAVSSGVVEVTPYLVRITATDLAIRKEPSTDAPRVPQSPIKPGVYTITAESNGKGATKWGRLKSGVGWVSLDFCKKV